MVTGELSKDQKDKFGHKYIVLASVVYYNIFRFVLEKAFLFYSQSKKYISSEISWTSSSW